MYFHNLPAALAMGGHGPFVWTAYLIAALVIATMLLAPWLRQRRLLRELAGELRRREAQQGAALRGTP